MYVRRRRLKREMSGFGGFGDVRSDWVGWLRSAYRGEFPALNVASVIADHASVDLTATMGDWLGRLPHMTCTELARSIGQSYDTTAICGAFDDVFRVASIGGSGAVGGWDALRARIGEELDTLEAARWEEATCADRDVADGGGSVCTASDGAQQLRCYNPSTGETDIHDDASMPCPPGTGGTRPVFTARQSTRTLSPQFIVDKTTSGKPMVTGVVIGPGGSPILGATVRLVPPGGGLMMTFAMPSDTTDETGAFAVQARPGEFEVVVSAAGFPETSFGVITVPETGTVDLGDTPLVLVPVGGSSLECDEGEMIDPGTGSCAPVPTECPDGQEWDFQRGICRPTCPEGQAYLPLTMDTEGAWGCQPVTMEGSVKPWYKTGWGIGLLVAGGVVVIGGGVLVVRHVRG